MPWLSWERSSPKRKLESALRLSTRWDSISKASSHLCREKRPKGGADGVLAGPFSQNQDKVVSPEEFDTWFRTFVGVPPKSTPA